jgi:hypothetical protein
MSNLIVDVIPFRPVTSLVESKTNPGIYEVQGVLQRAEAQNQNGRVYKKAILEREVKKYTQDFIKAGNAYGRTRPPRFTRRIFKKCLTCSKRGMVERK